MIGRWFWRRVEIASAKGAREDIIRFIDSLRGLSPTEIAGLRILATVMRMTAVNEGNWPSSIGDVNAPSHPAAQLQLKIAQQIKSFQRDKNTAAAAALMVWLHSLRSSTIPEIRFLGREMWAQLERGRHLYAEGAALLREQGVDLPMRVGGTYLIEEMLYVPNGLEPQK